MNKLTRIWLKNTHDFIFSTVPWGFQVKFFYRKLWKWIFITIMDSLFSVVSLLRVLAYKLTGISKVYEFLVFLTLLTEPCIFIDPDVKATENNKLKMLSQYFKAISKRV